MYDKSLALEILSKILGATGKIKKRFEPIGSVEDFTNSDGGWRSSTLSACNSLPLAKASRISIR